MHSVLNAGWQQRQRRWLIAAACVDAAEAVRSNIRRNQLSMLARCVSHREEDNDNDDELMQIRGGS